MQSSTSPKENNKIVFLTKKKHQQNKMFKWCGAKTHAKKNPVTTAHKYFIGNKLDQNMKNHTVSNHLSSLATLNTIKHAKSVSLDFFYIWLKAGKGSALSCVYFFLTLLDFLCFAKRLLLFTHSTHRKLKDGKIKWLILWAMCRFIIPIQCLTWEMLLIFIYV